MNNFIGYLRFKSLQYRNSYLYAMTHMQGAMSKDYFTSTRGCVDSEALQKCKPYVRNRDSFFVPARCYGNTTPFYDPVRNEVIAVTIPRCAQLIVDSRANPTPS
ncbi:hypothetical protein CDAR_194671 [Caerostris darwini]|uniref:Uncharacterized protein n=1 Tax=Caerostris darwini TaxID=1538125 RepID=A0AAV4X5G3_9ARAC|nr:hypothetical protein CDAR_194671 [Caerostris darwini]